MLSPKVRVCTQEDIGGLVATVRKSFQDVAKCFGLNPENGLHHLSNRTNENVIVGCVAFAQANSEVCYVQCHKNHGYEPQSKLLVVPTIVPRRFAPGIVRLANFSALRF